MADLGELSFNGKVSVLGNERSLLVEVDDDDEEEEE